MTLSVIVAKSKNNIIGRENKLPWRLPLDLKNFKQVTLEKPILMGRKTYDSIGYPLPGRLNVVLSKDEGYLRSLNNDKHNNLVGLNNFDEAVLFAKTQAKTENKEVFVIGGNSLFRESMSLGLVDKVYLTTIDGECSGDVVMDETLRGIENNEGWHCIEDRVITDPKSYFLEDLDKKPLTFRYQVLVMRKTV